MFIAEATSTCLELLQAHRLLFSLSFITPILLPLSSASFIELFMLWEKIYEQIFPQIINRTVNTRRVSAHQISERKWKPNTALLLPIIHIQKKYYSITCCLDSTMAIQIFFLSINGVPCKYHDITLYNKVSFVNINLVSFVNITNLC